VLGRARSEHFEDESTYRILSGNSDMKRSSGRTSSSLRIILEWMLGKRDGSESSGYRSGWGPVARSCHQGNQTSASIKDTEFLD
jgi:hypothetical protein